MWPNFFTGLPFLFPSLGRTNYNTLPVSNAYDEPLQPG
jgi:hypothetical protein